MHKQIRYVKFIPVGLRRPALLIYFQQFIMLRLTTCPYSSVYTCMSGVVSEKIKHIGFPDIVFEW